MSKCPCPRHTDQNIGYIKFGNDQSRLLCNQCLNEDQYIYFQIIDIQKALKQPEQILMYFNQDLYQEVILNKILKFDENKLKLKMQDYEKVITDLQKNLTDELKKMKELSEQLIAKFKNFQYYIAQASNHDEFKKIVQEFESANVELNQTAFLKSEQTIHQFLQKINEQTTNLYSTNCNLNLKEKDDNNQILILDVVQKKKKQAEIIQYTLNLKQLHFPLLSDQFYFLSNFNFIFSFLNLENTIINISTYNRINNQQLIKQENQKLLENLLKYRRQSFYKYFMGQDRWKRSYSQNVFGGYSPCTWGKSINAYVEDTTVASFIFSQTNYQIFPLKADQKQYAIYNSISSGPYFGSSNGDLNITTSFIVSQGSPNCSYENNTGQIVQLNGTSTKIVECEIYQIIFE